MKDEHLDEILREAVAKKASDIHLKVGVPPYVRINGSLSHFSDAALSPEDLGRIVAALLDGDAEGRAKTRQEIDIAHTIPGVARFRCNIFKQRGSLEVVLRVVPYKIPTLEELNMPTILKHLALEARGLILVTGITGSGKSTTIAGMIQHMNQSLPVHVVTIEDPIEFVYRDEQASITQREVGIDTDTFHNALKYVLRQDPDVVLLGEMRDRETAATAMSAAETGHLVLSTLHTADSIQTIDRIVDMFPEGQHQQIRHQLASTLRATISQRLLTKIDGKGLAAAVEVMICTPAIHSLIQENKLGEIKSLMVEGGAQYGMQTFDQSILKLYNQKVISKETALEEATSPADLELAMKGITVGTMSAQSFLKGTDDNYYKEKAQGYFDRARRLFQQELFEDANREIRRALVDFPEFPEAKALLAQIEEKLKRDAAKSQVEPFIKKGLELVTQDRIEEALAVFNQGLAQDPQNEKLLTLKRAADEKGQRVRGIKPLMDRAVASLTASNWMEARTALNEILEKDPGNSDALDRYTELMAAQTRQQTLAELEALSAQADEASLKKMWFDAIAHWNLVREIQSDHAKAAARVGEAGQQAKMIGVPGLTASAQQPWVPQVISMYERGLTAFLGAQSLACLNEWRQIAIKIPQAADLLSANIRKIEELHAGHVRYHLERAKVLHEQGELGRAMAQLRHALQVDPQSAEARASWDGMKPVADAAVQRFLADAEQWEKMDRLRAAVFCLERAFEIEPAREGLKARVTDGRSRLVKLKDIHAAMDRHT